MQNNVGIYASQISGHLWAPNGAMDALATVTLSSTAATITFAGIPQGYKHLQIRAITRATQAAGGTDIRITFNSDSGSNYSWHHLYGNGSAASATSGSSATYIRNMNNVDGSYSNTFSAAIYDILDYASTSKAKTLRCLSGFDANGDGHVKLLSGAWYNSSTGITSIDFTTPGTTFAANTTFALYGVK
jgi:hypothetical protein